MITLLLLVGLFIWLAIIFPWLWIVYAIVLLCAVVEND